MVCEYILSNSRYVVDILCSAMNTAQLGGHVTRTIIHVNLRYKLYMSLTYFEDKNII